MSTITISKAQGIGNAPYYTGLDVSGTATAGERVHVHYEIPASGVMSADLNTTAGDNGEWKVKFESEFNAGTDIVVVARLNDGAKAEKDLTLPS